MEGFSGDGSRPPQMVSVPLAQFFKMPCGFLAVFIQICFYLSCQENAWAVICSIYVYWATLMFSLQNYLLTYVHVV